MDAIYWSNCDGTGWRSVVSTKNNGEITRVNDAKYTENVEPAGLGLI